MIGKTEGAWVTKLESGRWLIWLWVIGIMIGPRWITIFRKSDIKRI